MNAEDQRYLNILNNAILKEIPAAENEQESILLLIKNIIVTDTRIQAYLNTQDKVTINTNSTDVHCVDKSLAYKEQVTLTYLKLYTDLNIAVLQLNIIDGFYMINVDRNTWAHFSKLRSVKATIRILSKDKLPDDLTKVYLIKLSNLVEHKSKLYQSLTIRLNMQNIYLNSQ